MTSQLHKNRRIQGRHGPVSVLLDREYYPVITQKDLLMRERFASVKSLCRRDLKAHYGCVNAIEFSHGGGEFVASGGDDRRVLLWKMEKALSDIGEPFVMKGEHNSNIFCLAFDNENKKVFSGGNDEQVSVHDLATGETIDVFLHEDAVYGLSVDPNNSNAFASACDDGRILIYDIREPPSTDPFCLANYMSSMHAVMYNPVEPRLLATANAKEGIGLWDIRKPKSCLLRYGSGLVQQSCMSVRISQTGDRLLALRRRLPPVLYNLHNNLPICEFDHSGYYNSCTMKSCTFAGDRDQYVISGSDDFNLYVWRIPDHLEERQYISDAHMILKGHRSIVNQVRFNPANHLVLSSGVEKIIKVWSPFPMKGTITNETERRDFSMTDRPIFTHEEYINLVLRSGHVMTHDYSHQSTNEDPRMLAFFDSLVQRELEGCSSDDNFSTEEEELFERIVQFSRSDLSGDSSEDSDNGNANNRTETSNNRESTTDSSSIFSPFTIAFASVMAAQAAESATEDTENARTTNPTSEADVENTENSVTESVSESTQTNNDRKSISDLISQKRKEMKKQALENKRQKKKRKRTSTISSSDSSDNENNADRATNGNMKRTVSCSGTEVNNPLEQKKKVQIKLKKLKQLRHNVLNSDSENSDFDNSKKPKLKTNASSTQSSGSKSEYRKHEEATSSKYSDNPEIGPYLHEGDSNHGNQSSKNNHSVAAESHSSRHNGFEFQSDVAKNNSHNSYKNNTTRTTSNRFSDSGLEIIKDKVCESMDSDQTNNGKVLNINHSENSLKCDLKTDTENGHYENQEESTLLHGESSHQKTVENNLVPETSSSVQNTSRGEGHNSDNSDNQPSWMEFKRFKRHIDRTKRRYRHRSTSDED